jgi:hypothetical protein
MSKRHLDCPVLSPGDRDGARAYLKRLREILPTVTRRDERKNLLESIHKWERRAAGKDPRFMVMGNKPGRPNFHQQRRMAKLGWVSTHESIRVQHPNRQCIFCNVTFTPARSDHKFCKPGCRTRYHYAKWKEANNDS